MSDIILVHCVRCNQNKPETEFYLFKKGPKAGTLKHPCKECIKADNKARYVPKTPPPPPVGQKRCPHCLQIFVATTEFFYSNKSNRDGLHSLCKSCHHEYEQSRHKRPKQNIPATIVCRACGQEKPATLEYFHADKVFAHGLRSTCKECANAGKREYYHTHPELKKWNAEYARNRPLEIREARLAYVREWHHLNRERINLRVRAYRKTGKEKARRRIETSNRQALKRQAAGTHTDQQIKEQYTRQKNRCYWCKTDLRKEIRTPHIDHILPLSRGGSNNIDNLVIACHRCNESRNNRLPHEWNKGGRLL